MRLTIASAILAGLASQGLALPTDSSEPTVPPNEPLLHFETIPPEQQRKQLDDSARRDPSSVRYVPGVEIPEDVAHPLMANSSATAGSKSGYGGCTNPEIFYEWREASETQRQQYTDAMQCMTTQSPRSGLSGVVTRWDDLVAIHRGMIYTVHNTGAFLHWHRYFLWVLRRELRNACEYDGPMLWWDETKDAGHFASAPMMNGDYLGDFPIDAEPQNVTNGKFGNLQLHLGPEETNTNLNTCLSWNKFENMTLCIENGPHGAGHNGIGGIMQDVFSSPGDPLFFFHHAFIDRMFWKWQEIDPAARNDAVGGIKVRGCKENCEMVTPDYELTAFDYAESHPIRDLGDTTGDLLCYQYSY